MSNLSKIPRTFRFARVVLNSPSYKRDTQELYRLQEPQIKKLAALQQLCHFWVRSEIIYGKGLDTSKRHFLVDRLQLYKDRINPFGGYPELLEPEYTFIKDLDKNIRTVPLHHIRIVEVGFNAQKEICKMGLVFKMQATGRYVFMCIGMDRGLKTFYVTPEYKHRLVYKTPSGVTALNPTRPPAPKTKARGMNY
jgi:hypothetical protein